MVDSGAQPDLLKERGAQFLVFEIMIAI